MKNYTVFVTDKRANEKFFFNSEDCGGYSSKKKFVAELHSNGYTVHRCEIKEIYDYVLENTNCEKVDYEAARLAYRDGRLDGISREDFAEYREKANEVFFAKNDANISVSMTPP